MLLLSSLAMIAFTAVVIMYAANSFEDAADFLGRHMRPGIKGATINAIGSSLPELFTTSVLLFGPVWMPSVFGDRADGFSAGIATTAGSAVFNAVIIPGLCILAVMFIGIRQNDGTYNKVSLIELDKRVVLKDGIFFILAEVCLIYFLRPHHGVVDGWGPLSSLYYLYFRDSGVRLQDQR
jgi:cation:H+ antiporter